jgi:hypothetical protein
MTPSFGSPGRPPFCRSLPRSVSLCLPTPPGCFFFLVLRPPHPARLSGRSRPSPAPSAATPRVSCHSWLPSPPHSFNQAATAPKTSPLLPSTPSFSAPSIAVSAVLPRLGAGSRTGDAESRRDQPLQLGGTNQKSTRRLCHLIPFCSPFISLILATTRLLTHGICVATLAAPVSCVSSFRPRNKRQCERNDGLRRRPDPAGCSGDKTLEEHVWPISRRLCSAEASDDESEVSLCLRTRAYDALALRLRMLLMYVSSPSFFFLPSSSHMYVVAIFSLPRHCPALIAPPSSPHTYISC